MTRAIFQVTQTMIESSSTLSNQELGLWCFNINGRWHGFVSTRNEACMLMSLTKAKD